MNRARRLNATLERLRGLPKADRATLVLAAACLPLIGVSIRGFGLIRTHRWLERLARMPHPLAASSDSAGRVAALVDKAAAHCHFPGNCLTRSVTLWYVLRRRGLSAQIRIGVRKNSTAIDAHAWVDYQGVPLNDRPQIESQFQAFESPLSPVAPSSYSNR